MAAGDHVMSVDAIAYYNSGTNASPTWVAITQIESATVDDGSATGDVSTRESDFKSFGAGQVDLTINLNGYLHVLGADTVFTAIQGAGRHLSAAPTPIQIAIMDQAIATNGAKGWKGFCIMESMPQSGGIDDAIKYDISLKPTRHVESSSVVPAIWFVVSA